MRRSQQSLDRKRDAFVLHIRIQHLHLDDLPHLDSLRRFFDVPVGEFTDVNQTILVYPDIYKCPKLRDVGNHAFQRHSRLQVRKLLHIVMELRRDKLIAWIAAGLLQFLQNVVERIDAYTQVFFLDQTEKFRFADQFGNGDASGFRDLLDYRVRLRMHRRIIQRILPTAYPQEARCLFKSLRPDACNRRELHTRAEFPVIVPVLHDLLRRALADARHIAKQRPGRGV